MTDTSSLALAAHEGRGVVQGVGGPFGVRRAVRWRQKRSVITVAA
jgi:hypothetical protein